MTSISALTEERDKKIFLTGATGFIGSHILRLLLKQGYRHITCLKRNTSDTSLIADIADKCDWIVGDMEDYPLMEEALYGQDVVINAAAQVTFDLKNKNKLLKDASDSAASIVNASLHHQVSKFIHISSIAALGRRKLKDYIDEKSIFSHSPYDTTYGHAKFLAEQEVWRGHAEEGLNVTILNPSMVLGVGNWNASTPQMFARIYNGMQFYPSGVNGWVDVRDVAQAVIITLEGNFTGERYIISSENLPYVDILNMIADGLKVRRPSSPVTLSNGPLYWRLDALKSFFTGSEPILTKETFMSTSVHAFYDNQKSIKELNMNYRCVRETIHETCEAFLSSYPSGKAFSYPSGLVSL
ncbi:MAG: NAD-dependent epimerase/dehydratase family protein [Chitinophagales bacterium]|nr:NAD-dependent epimerase/dehydratase family protein [Chitinophagales bacterium]